MVVVVTLALSGKFLVWVGKAYCTLVMMEALLKIAAVSSGPKPKRPTYLSVGLDLLPPRLVMLWYIAREDDLGAFARMIMSMSLAKLPLILAPSRGSWPHFVQISASPGS